MDRMYEEMLNRVKGRHANSLRVFEENLDFVLALRTETGAILMKDLLDAHEELFRKIAAVGATDAEKAAYAYLSNMVARWASRIADYERKVEEYNARAGQTT